ncbi:MAG: DUF4296 domain-containing protein [Rikenellaceae bacterium]
MRIGKSYVLRLFGVVAILLSTLSCTKQKSLTDKELAMVFRDAFLSNAYTTNHGIKLDSLRLYEPIFQKYGYTTADVQHTIGSFSTRKSARLSDVVEDAIAMLEGVGKELDYQVSILDTIDQIAIRRTVKSIYQDSLIEMRSLRDSSKFILTFDNLEPGSYDLKFNYLIDSLDKTAGNYQTISWGEDQQDTLKKRKQTRRKSAILQRNKVSTYSNIIAVDTTANRVVIHLLSLPEDRGNGTPYATIKNLTINTRPTKAKARDSIFQELFTVRIFDDELLFPKERAEDSL